MSYTSYQQSLGDPFHASRLYLLFDTILMEEVPIIDIARKWFDNFIMKIINFVTSSTNNAKNPSSKF